MVSFSNDTTVTEVTRVAEITFKIPKG